MGAQSKTYTFLSPSELKEVRRLLRNLHANSRLEARRTYYDYYDSCHPPVETPDAPFVSSWDWIREDSLKSGGGSISLKGNGIWELSNGYSNFELRIKGSK